MNSEFRVPNSDPREATPGSRAGQIFAGAVGTFLGIALWKFGNPVILDHKLPPPEGFWEFIVWSWPVAWGHALLALVVILGLLSISSTKPAQPEEKRDPANELGPNLGRHPSGDWVKWLPLAWLVWQCLSATQTTRWDLTLPTLKHFAASVVCFYLGLLLLSRVRNLTWMWLAILAGFIGVIAVGFDQHFGGLEATRRFIYAQPDWQSQSPEFLKKITSNRIYSTLFYPNTLAGVLLLFTPILLGFVGTMPAKMFLRWLLGIVVAVGSLACLAWSGSKAGWLIALGLVLAAWLHSRAPTKAKWLVVVIVTAVALTGFFFRHRAYFEKGATSVSARFDYWQAAVQIAASRPILGCGPGAFSALYRQLKKPEAEMARLVHNDYLEQACDSGIGGFVLYGVMVAGSLLLLYHRAFDKSDWLRLGIWLGLAGWALQGIVEFGLYVPAMAWPAFLFLGWLHGTRPSRNAIDKQKRLR